MCVAALAFDAHPKWKLVAIGNRDEFHERPSAPLAEWDDGSGIVAGRDLQSGGTWLGASEAGQFALVTNLRGFGAPDPAKLSRGELVTDLLVGKELPAELDRFNPFNVLQVNGDGAHFISNRPQPISAQLAQGVYGLSNGTLDEPWAKTIQLKSALLEWLVREGDDVEPLFAALRSEELGEFGLDPSSPSEMSLEPRETPVFIRHSLYGTRCSTVVTVDHAGCGRIIERRFDPEGKNSGETALEFEWPA